MNIFGEKVMLRAIEESDNEMLLELLNDHETEAMLGGWSFPQSMKDQLKWYKDLNEGKSVLRCAIVVNNKAIGTLIMNQIDYKNGTACINIKLVSGEYRGHGYGTDAVKTICHYAFCELRLNCLYALVLEYNTPSRRLFEKCGFVQEGILRARCFKNGEYNNYVSYSALRGDYECSEMK